MRGPEVGVLSVSADSWQRLFRNRVRRPQDGPLSEALLISGKDTSGTGCAVQKTVSFRRLCRFLAKTDQELRARSSRRRPLGVDSPGPRVRPESARMFTGVLLTFLQLPLRSSRKPQGKPSFVRTTIHKTPPLMSPLYFWQRLTSECARMRSPGCDCPLPVNVYLRRTVTSVNRIVYLQADYDVL